MSRQIFHRYLLFYLSVSAIRVCGSSRRIPRGASCPSCSQDCPEALTVQLPWYSDQEPNNLQPVLRNFPNNLLRNSLHSRDARLIQRRIPQNMHDNNILMNQNLATLRNYKNFSPQEPASGNSLFKNLFNNIPKFSDKDIFSQNKSVNRYPLARIFPSKQIFRLENAFRNPRNKYSSSSLEDNFENNIKNQKDPTSKSVYRIDKDTKLLDSTFLRDASSSNFILPQSPKIENTFRFRRDPIPHIFNEKRNAIRNVPNPVNQQYNPTYLQKEYNTADFILPEIKRDDPNIHSLRDLNIWKSTKNDEFFDNWDNIKDSSQSLNLKQLKQTENNFLEMHPTKEEDIITENNEQINKSYMLPQNLNTWKLKDEKESFNDWNYAAYKDENNWPQVFTTMEKNIKNFENENGKEFMEQENINQEYFEDRIVQDVIDAKQSRYNPYDFSQNINNWEAIQDKELFNNLDFTHKNLQKTDQLGMPFEENNDKFFQNEKNEDIIFESKTQVNDDRINRAPVVNAYNAYYEALLRYLDILNDAKPVDSLEIQKIPKAKNILNTNHIKEKNEKLFVNEDIQNDTPIQDLISSKDIFDMDEYKNHIVDKKNIKDNTEMTRLDPDLLDDIEDLPLEPTESTSIETLAEFSTLEK